MLTCFIEMAKYFYQKRIICLLSALMLLNSCENSMIPNKQHIETIQSGKQVTSSKITAPPKGVTNQVTRKGPTMVSPDKFTVPPRGITAPPKGITAPPKGFTALTGFIHLPAGATLDELNQQSFGIKVVDPSTIASQLRLKSESKVLKYVFQEPQINQDGSFFVRYFIPEFGLDERQINVITVDRQSVLLKTDLSLVDEESVLYQDIDAESTAHALLKDNNSELTIFDISQSKQLEEISQQISQRLSQVAQPNLERDTVLQTQVRRASETIPRLNKHVESLLLNPLSIRLAPGESQKLEPKVIMNDGSINHQVVWSTSDPQIAVVDAKSKTLHAFKNGTAIIKVFAESSPSATVALKLTVSEQNEKVETIYNIFSPIQGGCSQYTVIPDDGSIEVPSSGLDGFSNFKRLKKEEYVILPDGGVKLIPSNQLIPPPGHFPFKEDGSVIINHIPDQPERVLSSNLFKTRPDGSIIIINSGERVFPPFCPSGKK